MKKSLASLLALFTVCLCLAGCYDMGKSAAAPTDVTVIPGDGIVTVTWTQAAGVEYWLMYAASNSVTVKNWADLGGRAIIGATSPWILTDLTNGTTYAFTIDGRTDGGPGGDGSPSQTATPRLAGSSWSANTALANDLRGIVYGNSKFIAVGSNGLLYSSPDISAVTPIVWTARTNPINTLPNLNAVTAYSTEYLTVGDSGAILSSSDAITWTQQTSNTTKNLHAVASNGAGSYIAVGQDGTILSSSDGQTWTTRTSNTTKHLYTARYANSLWIAAGQDGALLTSSDAITWTSRTSNTVQTLRSLAYGAVNQTTTYLLAAVGDNGALITSSDGVTWNAQTPITTGNMKAVTYGTQYVAVGDSGGIFTSPDGTTWQAATSGAASNLNGIARGLYGYVTVGAAGTNLTGL